MLAYKTQLNINNEILFLKVPSNFKGKRVEIIVLETNSLDDSNDPDTLNDVETFYEKFSVVKAENQIKSNILAPNEFQKFLLTSPTWGDDEYLNFIETRKLFNQWKID